MRLHWPLFSMAALFCIPVAAAMYMLNHRDTFNFAGAEHGSFIAPPQHIALHNIKYLAGNAQQLKWTLVYLEPEACDLACQQHKRLLQNLYTALGADKDRVAVIAIDAKTINLNIANNSILIVDPHGLGIMQYTGNLDHIGILKDLKRLLKYSHA